MKVRAAVSLVFTCSRTELAAQGGSPRWLATTLARLGIKVQHFQQQPVIPSVVLVVLSNDLPTATTVQCGPAHLRQGCTFSFQSGYKGTCPKILASHEETLPARFQRLSVTKWTVLNLTRLSSDGLPFPEDACFRSWVSSHSLDGAVRTSPG